MRRAPGAKKVINNVTTKGEHEDQDDDAERERLRRWREICAQRPPLTRRQVEEVGALLRAIDERRRGKVRRKA
jgi:hypothetical protein